MSCREITWLDIRLNPVIFLEHLGSLLKNIKFCSGKCWPKTSRADGSLSSMPSWVLESKNKHLTYIFIGMASGINTYSLCINKLQEREKMFLTRVSVIELVQAMKFKSNIPDCNFLMLVTFILQVNFIAFNIFR